MAAKRKTTKKTSTKKATPIVEPQIETSSNGRRIVQPSISSKPNK